MTKSVREELALRGCDLVFEYKRSAIGVNTKEFTEEKEDAAYQKFGLKTLRGKEGITLYNPEIWRVTDNYELSLVEDCLAPEQPFFTVAPRLQLEGIKNLSHWDVASAKSLSRMFYGCESLKELILDGWDVSRSEDFSAMFYLCRYLEKLSLDGWDVSSAKNLRGMFDMCSSLKRLILDGWDVSRVESMEYMFHGCESLEILSLNGWDVSRAKTLACMFYGCKTLKNLSLDGWCIGKDATTICMFENCTAGINVEDLGGKRGFPQSCLVEDFDGSVVQCSVF